MVSINFLRFVWEGLNLLVVDGVSWFRLVSDSLRSWWSLGTRPYLEHSEETADQLLLVHRVLQSWHQNRQISARSMRSIRRTAVASRT